MTMVVNTDAVVDPRTVMILLSDTATTSVAMLTPQRSPYHTLDTEVLFIELRFLDELLYNGFLFLPA